jgi:hypothetical protein
LLANNDKVTAKLESAQVPSAPGAPKEERKEAKQ